MKRHFGLILLLVWSAPAARAADEAPDFVRLFNGKDLTGWKTYPRGVGTWQVEDGAIVGTGRASHLFTDRGDFADFHLRAEVMINDGGNSGLYFRTQFGPGFPKGYEAQINSSHADPIRTGSLYPTFDRTLSAAQRDKLLVTDTLVKAGVWFTYEAIAKGDRLTLKVNGKTTVEFTDERRTYRKGHFAFQQHHEGSVLKVRKVEVKELKTGK